MPLRGATCEYLAKVRFTFICAHSPKSSGTTAVARNSPMEDTSGHLCEGLGGAALLEHRCADGDSQDGDDGSEGQGRGELLAGRLAVGELAGDPDEQDAEPELEVGEARDGAGHAEGRGRGGPQPREPAADALDDLRPPVVVVARAQDPPAGPGQ